MDITDPDKMKRAGEIMERLYPRSRIIIMVGLPEIEPGADNYLIGCNCFPLQAEIVMRALLDNNILRKAAGAVAVMKEKTQQ